MWWSSGVPKSLYTKALKVVVGWWSGGVPRSRASMNFHTIHTNHTIHTRNTFHTIMNFHTFHTQFRVNLLKED